MNFGFTEEQNLLREQVERFMREDCSLAKVRELCNEQKGFDISLWEKIAELGWLALTIDPKYGGLGLKWVDLTVVLEETAKGLSPFPILSQALSSALIDSCGSEHQKERWLPKLANGEMICAIALYDEPNWISEDSIRSSVTLKEGSADLGGIKPFVNDANLATHLLVMARSDSGLKVAMIEKTQARINIQPTVDTTKPMASVNIDGVSVSRDDLMDCDVEKLDYITNCGALGTTAEMVGSSEALLNLTNEYAKQRIQFGAPIGKYQGVKHRLADIYVDLESFKSLCHYAAWCADDKPEEFARAVSMAKGYSSDAFNQIGIDGVGLHGAIGFTDEYDAQLYLKRSKWARPMFGDSNFHMERIAQLGGI